MTAEDLDMFICYLKYWFTVDNNVLILDAELYFNGEHALLKDTF